MSSPPSSTGGAWRRYFRFERWRKLMLTGALILLGHALLDVAVQGKPPQWLTFAAFGLGYGFLVAGFGVRMRETKAAREKARTASKKSVVATEDQPHDDPGKDQHPG